MPRLVDHSLVLTQLNRDRAWAAYAIGDLSPALVDGCAWHAPADGAPGLVLLYRGFQPPILFAMGEPSALAPLMTELDAPQVSLHLRPEALEALHPTYAVIETQAMWRMALDPASFRPQPDDRIVSLDEGDAAQIEALYEDGRQDGEMPAFFQKAMLRQGTFRGIREAGALVAVAGTHLFSPELRVCAVGNVYTRRDRRRRGLAARVTSAVVAHALALGVETIVLNVSHGNPGARAVYESLGFRCHCSFFEGAALRAAVDEPPPAQVQLS